MDSAKASSTLPPMRRQSSSWSNGSNAFLPIRPVKTKRPFTPRETERSLFHPQHGLLPNNHSKLAPLPLVSPNDSFSSPTSSAGSTRGSSASASTRLPNLEHLGSNQLCLSARFVRKQFRHLDAGRKDTLVEEEDAAKEVEAEEKRPSVEEVLNKLESSKSEQETLESLKQLKSVLQDEKVDSVVKKHIFQLVNPLMTSERWDILILVLDVLLLLRVSKSNFVMASKLFFHIASSDQNDQALLRHNTIAHYLYMLGKTCCPVRDQEAMLYGYAALKFLSFNPKLLTHLCDHGLVDLLVLHLKVLCSATASDVDSQQGSNVLFQMTACLRNALNCDQGREALNRLDGQPLLINTIQHYSSYAEVMCNVSRILSVLSLESSGPLYKPVSIDHVFKLLETYPKRSDLVVRLAFCLGNLAAHGEDCRMYIAEHPLMEDFMPEVLESYLHLASSVPNSVKRPDNNSGESGEDTSVDTAVKLIRIFANVSLQPEAGKKIALNKSLLQALLFILDQLEARKNGDVSEDKDDHFDDLLLPTLATLNNLSFYPILLCMGIFQRLKSFVQSPQESVRIESMRVLGNLSRRREIRRELQRDDDFLQAVLQCTGSPSSSYSRDLCFSAVGVVVNLMTSSEFRPVFRQRGGIGQCLEILRRTGATRDWPLASLVCQLLWNYCIDCSKAEEAFEKAQFEALEKLLVTLLDNEEWAEVAGRTTVASSAYEEFSTVGFHLLSKLYGGQKTVDEQSN